jgi:hypothetical protein
MDSEGDQTPVSELKRMIIQGVKEVKENTQKQVSKTQEI